MDEYTIETFDLHDGDVYAYRFRFVADNDGESPRLLNENLARPILFDDRRSTYGNLLRTEVEGDDPNHREFCNVVEVIERRGSVDAGIRYMHLAFDSVAVQFSFRNYHSHSFFYMPRSVAREAMGEDVTDAEIVAAIETEMAYYKAWADGNGFGFVCERASLAPDANGEYTREWNEWEPMTDTEIGGSVWGYLHDWSGGLDWEHAKNEATAIINGWREDDDRAHAVVSSYINVVTAGV